MALNQRPFYGPDSASGPWIADRLEAEKVVGRGLPDELWAFAPWGRRLLIVREPPEATYGSLVIPDVAQDSNSKAMGWVLSAGELVGTPDPRLPLGASPYRAEEIILRKVAFGRHAGIVFAVTEEPDKDLTEKYTIRGGGNRKYLHPYILLTDGDILGEIDNNAVPKGGNKL